MAKCVWNRNRNGRKTKKDGGFFYNSIHLSMLLMMLSLSLLSPLSFYCIRSMIQHTAFFVSLHYYCVFVSPMVGCLV